MRKIDIVICLKRRKKRLKEYKTNYREAKKSLNIVIDKIVF